VREFHLPKSKEKVGEMLAWHYDANRHEQYQKRVGWTIAHWWLQGMRVGSLKRHGSQAGLPGPSMTDEKGRRRVRIEKALVQYQGEVGRLHGIDLNPAVIRRAGGGLDGLRSESLAQAVADEIAFRQTTQVYHTFKAMLPAYGTVGVAVTESAAPYPAWVPRIVIIPPWELRPLPASPMTVDEVAGVVWDRWVPLDWLKSKYGEVLNIPKGEAGMVKLQLYKMPRGAKINTENAPQPLGGVYYSSMHGGTPGAGSPGNLNWKEEPFGNEGGAGDEYYVNLREHYIWGQDNTLTAYTVMLGPNHVARHEDFRDPQVLERIGGEIPMNNVHVARYLEVGSFWGRSYVDRLIPLNKELEYLAGEAIQNMREVNRLTQLWLPAAAGVNQRSQTATNRNRINTYQPNPLAPTRGPEVVGPPSNMDQGMGIVQALGSMMNDVGAQGEMMYGGVPGRLDSFQGLGLVAEQTSVPLQTVAESIEQCWSGVWRAALGYTRLQLKRMQDLGAPVPLLRLHRFDETALGLVLNAKTGEVELDQSPVPSPIDLRMTIRSKLPRPKQAIHQMIKEKAQSGEWSPVEVEIAEVKEGLDLPFVSKLNFNNWQSAWYNMLVMFGDGAEPGTVELYEFGDNHAIHYLVAMEVISSMPFRMASDEVQAKIIQYGQAHFQLMGGRYPEQVALASQFGDISGPNPELMQAAGMQPPGMQGVTPTGGSPQGPPQTR
jgi:hypothetical protein